MKNATELAIETCKALNLPPEGHAALAIEQAILAARAQDPDTLRDELRRAQADRESWMQQFLLRGEEVRRLQEELTALRSARKVPASKGAQEL